MQSEFCRCRRAGLTLIELLCVFAIIMVLVGLLLGPASRVLQRVREDQWGDQAGARLQAVVEQLQNHCRARPGFPLLTLERLRTERLLGSAELAFLNDPRVTFMPFAGLDSDDKVVLRVVLRKGYFTEAGILTETKGDICKVPE